jgi:hypothetical protein
MTTKLNRLSIAVMNAVAQMHLYPVKVQVRSVIEALPVTLPAPKPAPAPLQLIAKPERKPPVKLEANTGAVSTATAGLATVQSLTAEAKRAKARSAIYEVGRIKIEARYTKHSDEMSYFIGGWPCYAEDVHELLAEVHSGRGTGGMQV